MAMKAFTVPPSANSSARAVQRQEGEDIRDWDWAESSAEIRAAGPDRQVTALVWPCRPEWQLTCELVLCEERDIGAFLACFTTWAFLLALPSSYCPSLPLPFNFKI